MIDAHKAVLPEPKLPTTFIAKPGLIVFAISNPISLVSSILLKDSVSKYNLSFKYNFKIV